ncbi:MAG: sensor protein [Actinomycetia bacterium]|nr:sensor protein [Actinomycetes bacterium]
MVNLFEPDPVAVDTEDLDLVFEHPLTEALDAPLVRHRIREILAGCWLEPRLDAIALASTELIANALRHGSQPARFRLLTGADRAVVAVYDASDRQPRFDPSLPLTTTRSSGRGLFLVRAESDHCGAYASDGLGKWVYAEWLRDPTGR